MHPFIRSRGLNVLKGFVDRFDRTRESTLVKHIFFFFSLCLLFTYISFVSLGGCKQGETKGRNGSKKHSLKLRKCRNVGFYRRCGEYQLLVHHNYKLEIVGLVSVTRPPTGISFTPGNRGTGSKFMTWFIAAVPRLSFRRGLRTGSPQQ